MPRSPDHLEPDTRLVFDSGGFRYELYRTLVKHRDHDTLMIVWRQPVGGGPRAQVLLKPPGQSHHKCLILMAWPGQARSVSRDRR